ncbi:MAG: MvdC/MvdD family ATP grasp protein [Ardenticatenaceae bacterium]
MILIVTNKKDYTADYLILEMKKRGIDFVRLNTEEFPTEVELSLNITCENVEGKLIISNKIIELNEIQSIWYRRPVPSEPARQITDESAKAFIIAESWETFEGLWKILPCFWMSHPDKLRVAESKLYQLRVASSLGFIIPQTLVTNSPHAARHFYHSSSQSVIYKPQRHARVIRKEKASLIYTNIIKEDHFEYFENVRFAPVLLQPYIQKKLEIRATVVCEQVFAVELHSQEIPAARHDWRRVDASKLKHVPHRLPSKIARKCIHLVKYLELSFGAIDLILTPDGEYVFLEINPNGQWAWIQQMCPEVRIREAIINLLVSGGIGV